jgi:uncharacterized protein (TIGR03435 family)
VWASSDRYTVAAMVGEPVSRELMNGPMMQALLEDRFKLKLHRETRGYPVYELTVASNGPKLQASKDGNCVVPCGAVVKSAPNGGIEMRRMTIADLCQQFSASADRDVIDKTGITGVFDIHFDLSFAHFGYRRRRRPRRLLLRLMERQALSQSS